MLFIVSTNACGIPHVISPGPRGPMECTSCVLCSPVTVLAGALTRGSELGRLMGRPAPEACQPAMRCGRATKQRQLIRVFCGSRPRSCSLSHVLSIVFAWVRPSGKKNREINFPFHKCCCLLFARVCLDLMLKTKLSHAEGKIQRLHRSHGYL